MKPKKQIIFPPFCLDKINQQLYRGEQVIPLRPKVFALLQYLLENPGQLVTKDELIDAIWPELSVGDSGLKVCIKEIRDALDDNAAAPRFIETAHRRGYKFIGQILVDNGSVEELTRPSLSLSPHGFSPLGREAELAKLEQCMEKALRAERQTIFVTGEPGIGKTTLVEAFLERVSHNSRILTVRGHCLEQYGSGEAYMPVLEALNRLCRGPGQESIIPLLGRYAPTWLAQMPWLVSAADREALQREILGATRERMIREMAEAVEALTADTLLLLVLEDLHWSDYSTLDLISYLARRREAAQLMLVGTYRPLEAFVSNHPLKAIQQELQMHGRCQELPLGFLTQESVSKYLEARFAPNDFGTELARLIHHHTDGNPLFMVNLADYLLAQGSIIQIEGQWRLKAGLEKVDLGVPDNIRQMIEKQIDQLSEDKKRMLEAASVAGVNFTAAAVAAGIGQSAFKVEEWCEAMARSSQFLRQAGPVELPNQTVTASYSFIHALYQNLFYNGITAARRVDLHQRIGKHEESAYGEKVGKIAAELAMHFEQARDYHRAIKYLRLAAENSTCRYANSEAIIYLRRALDLACRLPETEQSNTKMALFEQLGFVRRSIDNMKGALEDFQAMAECARNIGVESETKALLQMCSALFWIDREQCLAVAEKAVELSRQVEDQFLKAHARGYCSNWRLQLRGWSDEDFQTLETAIEAVRRAEDRPLLALYLGSYCVHLSVLRSQYRTVCQIAPEAMRVGEEVGDAYSYMATQVFYNWSLFHLGEWGEMLRLLEDGFRMARLNGHQRTHMVLQLELAWLHEQVFDFEPALELCKLVSKQVQELQLEDVPLFMSQILLGFVHLGLKQHDEAFRCFSAITERLEQKHTLMDWHFHMPLRYGLSRYWLMQKDLDKARGEAERVCDLAVKPGELTYLTLGKQTLAEVAMAEKNFDKAEEELSQALALLQRAEVPLAEWRVYATAARLRQKQSRQAEAEQYRAKSAAVLERLAESLGDAERLRQSLLNNPEVKAILRQENANHKGTKN